MTATKTKANKVSDTHAHPMARLIEIMAALRNPDGGCPWDLEQNFKTIAPYTLEEAYEVADAIDRNDMKDLREELGDLLLQSVYHAQMASEAGHFDINDVINDIADKMFTRHPHVFGDQNAHTASDVNKIWDERKNEEKASSHSSALDGIASALPALLHAQKLTKKAAKVGFEWPTIERVLDKLEEEISELRETLASGDKNHQADELGDVLFVLANLGRMLDINAEESLRQTNNKFIRRFKGLEEELKQKYDRIEDASLEQMEQAWVRQKLKEK
jgi:ATP diphosphatase